MQESVKVISQLGWPQIITFLLFSLPLPLNKQRKERVERTSASLTVSSRNPTFGKEWNHAETSPVFRGSRVGTRITFFLRIIFPHSLRIFREFSPRGEKGKMAEEGKVNTHLLCDIPRDEGKGGRYAGTGWPWPRGESRGKSGFHGNRNPHLEDDLVVRRIDLFNHLAAVIEWCMPTIHHFFIQRKYRSTKASTDRGWMYKFFSPRLRVEEKGRFIRITLLNSARN